MQFKSGKYWCFFAFISLSGNLCFARETNKDKADEIFSDQEIFIDNPYINLYKKRLEVLQLESKSNATIAEQERIKWQRMKSLVASGAVPLNEAEHQEMNWKLATKKFEIALTNVVGAEALLSIARQRVGAGLEMPVCSAKQ